MFRLKHLLLYIIPTVLLSGCVLNSRPDTVDLCILYTSDTHSMVCPYDFHYNQEGKVGLCNFATLVKDQRSLYGDLCLVLDNGNKLSGGPTAYYYKFADTISEPICYRAEREIRYDALGLGAHDIEVPECLKPKRHDYSKQPPMLCANLINRQTRKPVYNPYKIYNCQGVRVAVMGMVAPTTGDWLPNELWNQFETEDMIECAKKWIPIIKEEKPDIIVGLFSCNDEYNDLLNDLDVDTYKNPAGGLPAAIRVPGFDVVLLGNSNKTLLSAVINDDQEEVPYVLCGENCEKAGMVRFHLQKDEQGNYEKRIFTSLVDLKQYAPAPEFVQQFRDAQDSIFLFFNRPIGHMANELWGSSGIYGPDYYRDFINTVQLWYASHEKSFGKADISFASVTIPHDTIFEGPLTMRDIFDIYPYHHQLRELTMTGEEVRRFLEWSCTCQFETLQKGTDHLLSLVKDPYGHILYNPQGQPHLVHDPSCFVSAGGIRYQVDLSKPAGERVEILSWSDGSEFDPRGLYRVVVNSEVLHDKGKFISRGLNWDRDELSLHAVPIPHNSLRKIIYDYVRYVDTVRIAFRHDWDIVPDALWQQAKTREQAELDPIW